MERKICDNVGSIVNRIPGVKALVIGDIMLDRFQYGKVERISPEAPVPVFKPGRVVEMLGGAGNTAINLFSLGCKVRLVGRTGRDVAADKILKILQDNEIEVEFYHQENCCTSVKTRLIAGNNHVLRIDEEQIVELNETLSDLAADNVRLALPEYDIVVISDYGKGFLSRDLLGKIINYSRSAGKRVIVDPKGGDYTKYAGATLVKPNLKEFSLVTGKKFDPKSSDFHADLIRAAKELLAKTGIEALLITLSEHGMLYVPSDNPFDGAIYLPTQAREVFDVSGAGDTTVAAIAASLAAGASMPVAMQIANAAAGVVVGKIGTATVSVKELKSALTDTGDDPARKILPLDELKREIAQLKMRGKRIGFTNGCFDCCHLGHLTSLREAKKLCDVLVVGVNSDEWIRNHKGDGRPIQDEATRTALIASLEYVDYVVVFGEETALPLVRELHPHVIAKEGYALKDWPEGRFVESIGGAAVILKRVEGYSTSALAERMKDWSKEG